MGQTKRRGLVVVAVVSAAFGVCAEARGETPCLLALFRAAEMVRARPSPPLVNFRAPSSALSPLVRSLHWVGRRLTARGDAERGLIKFLPIPGLGPSVTLEGGTLFDVDAKRLGRMFGIDPGAEEHLGYDFGDAHLGLEMGRARSYRLLIRGGVSMLQSKRSILEDPVGGWRDSGGQTRLSAGPHFGASGRITFVIYL